MELTPYIERKPHSDFRFIHDSCAFKIALQKEHVSKLIWTGIPRMTADLP